MHGNVWEYCLDKWAESYADAPRDGSAYLSGPRDSAADTARRIVVAQPGDLPLCLPG